MDTATLLGNTLSPDAVTRQDAESRLEAAATENYATYMTMLVGVLASEEAGIHIRSAAGLAVKNALSAREAARAEEYATRWAALDEATRTEVRTKALQTLTTQETRAGTAGAQVVAAIAAIEIPRGLWPNFVQQLLAAIGNAENSHLRQASLQAIGYTCESVDPIVLAAQSNEILTAVISGARKEEPSLAVRHAALGALLNSLEFVRANFDRDGERNYIMQVVCEATQATAQVVAEGSQPSPQDAELALAIKVSAFECLVRIMQLYYDKMQQYVEQALFGLTVVGMQDPEPKVALQAVEFWSTVCDEEIELSFEAEEVSFRDVTEEAHDSYGSSPSRWLAKAREHGEAPMRISYGLVHLAIEQVLPILLALLKRQDEDADEDEWDISKAAGTCVGLMAQTVGDEIVGLAVPFIEMNIKDADWHGREAAVMAFGSIMEGPQPQVLAPLVTQALQPIIEMLLHDDSVHVKDTAAWTLGRITDLLYETIDPSAHLPPLIAALLQGLTQEPRVVTNCCWALMNIVGQIGVDPATGAPAQTSPISPYFESMIRGLSQAAQVHRSTNESNCRTSAYEALAAAVNNAPDDCLDQASQVLLKIVEEQEQLNNVVSQIVGMDDARNWGELQSNMCSVIMASVRRIGPQVQPLGDRLMTSLLSAISACSQAKQSSVLEDAFLAVGAIISALEGGFEKYLQAFMPFMLQALRNHEETALCSVAVGLIGDLCRALGEQAADHCEGFMSALFDNLQSSVLNRAVKPPILSCFGDVALAIGAKFQPYLATTMTVLSQAAQMQTPQGSMDHEIEDFINALREGIAEAYTGIVSGLRTSQQLSLLSPHLESIFQFIQMVNNTPAEVRYESTLRATVGLVGDLAAAFPNGELKEPLQQPWLATLIKAARSRIHLDETRRVAAWARSEVKKASGATL